MVLTPHWVWKFTGSWPFSVYGIKPSEMESYRGKFLAGFHFAGEGWYQSHRVYIEPTGEERDGEKTYVLSFYDRDPRDEWLAAARAPRRT